MLFTKSFFFLLSSSALISAWEVHSVSDTNPRDHRSNGRTTSDCINRNHKRDDRLRFSREGSSCCMHLYKEVDCNLDQIQENKRSICRDYNQDIDFHFRSYYVDCDRRGINNPTPPFRGEPYGPSPNQPYNNLPYPSQPYNNPPYPNQPYNSPAPYPNQPYNSPAPYPNQPYNSPAPYPNQPYNSPAPYPNQPYNSPAPYCRPGDRCYVKEEAEAVQALETA